MRFRLGRPSAILILFLMSSLPLWGAEKAATGYLGDASDRDLDENALNSDAAVTLPGQPTTWGQAFDKHAPLAFFSAGSLAVGGLIAAIRADGEAPANRYGKSSQRDVVWAMGLSGAGALVAGAAFWYYAHAEVTRDPNATPEAFAQSPTQSLISLMPTFDGGFGWVAGLNVTF